MAATSPEELNKILSDAGYRQITVRSYNEFIAGVRYVAMETLGSTGLRVLQFLPALGSAASWDVVRWDSDEALYIAHSTRSQLEKTTLPPSGYDWYAKWSEVVNLDSEYYFGSEIMGRQPRQQFFMPLNLFLESTGGSQRRIPFDTQAAFERAHPKDQDARTQADLRRRLQEIEAREQEIKHRDNFAQVDELRSQAAQFLEDGNSQAASSHYRAADALRERIQRKIDAGEPVTRENIAIPTSYTGQLYAGQQIANNNNYLTLLDGLNGGIYGTYSNSMPRMSRVQTTQSLTAAPKPEPKVETLGKPAPRVIILNDED